MSLYHCAECGSPTSVIDTRPSFARLRRRRKCPHNHRVSTIEIPLTATEEIKGLMAFWAQETGQDQDFVSNLNSRVDEIMLGKPPPDG